MNKEEIISVVKEYVKNKCYNDSTGHDWWHVQRVYNNAMLINKKEDADEFIITIIVLMHDLYDHKFYNGNIAGKPIYDPNNSELVNEEEYKQKGSKTSIGHFYDKLLNIKNLMNTDTATIIAQERHKYLEDFLQEFFDEWNGKK